MLNKGDEKGMTSPKRFENMSILFVCQAFKQH